jgi:N,N'-diacetyllegionaminate synthase
MLPKIIAEIGFNHEGDVDVAQQMIIAAARAGADAVKFQTFRAEDLALPTAEHYSLVQRGEIDLEQHRRLASVADRHGVEFFSTPFSIEAVELLERIGVNQFKVASMDLTNSHLLSRLAETRKPLYLSTGMATVAEIAESLEFLRKRGAGPVSLLHCTSKYPAEASDLNLAAIPFLKNLFRVPVGYSDHYPGVKACLMAAMLGAEVLETHFTLDRSLPGADHQHSADPDQLRGLVEDIRLFQGMKGSEEFFSGRRDRENARIFRRGVYAARDLEAGSVVALDDLLLCRPESELSPNDLTWLVGRRLARPIKQHQALSREHV